MRLLALTILTLSIHCSFSQKAKDWIKKGDFDYGHHYYKEAVEDYLEAFQLKLSDEQRLHVKTQLGMSYYMLFDYENAEKYYNLICSDSILENEKAWLQYGHILRNLERYDDAIKAYHRYTDYTGDKEHADYFEKSCLWAKDHIGLHEDFDVHLTNLETGGRSFGVAFFEEGLLYSKSQSAEFDKKTTFYDLSYASRVNDSVFEDGKIIHGEMNHSFYEGAPTLTEDGLIMYFTGNASDRTKYTEASREKKHYHISSQGVNILKIFEVHHSDTGWSKRTELPFCNDEYSCTHPSITPDGKFMYFVSDMPGGLGKYDVYVSENQGNGLWSLPQNLGPEINTEENEMTPFIIGDTLYFSTKGSVGLGGADICKAILRDGKVQSVVHLESPFNSSKDDFAFIVKPDMEHGYFSSNREGTHGYDHVYYFERKPKPVYPDTIIGTAKNRITGEPISKVKVTVRPETDVNVNVKETDNGGEVTLILPKNKEFVVTFIAEGYEPKEIIVPAEDREDVVALFGQLELIPEAKKDDVIKIDNIYFDYDKSTIRDESIPTLESILEYMNFHKEIKVELSAHTDSRGSWTYNKKLSQRRAESTVLWLIDHGIAPERMTPVGYGESKIINHCVNGAKCTDEEHMENRRVELKVL